MDKLKYYFVLLLLTCSQITAKAQSFTASRLEYHWEQDSTYRLRLYLYSACDQPLFNLPDTVSICYQNQCNTTHGEILLEKLGPGSGNGTNFNRYTYQAFWTAPSRCHHWLFKASVRRHFTENLDTGSNMFVFAILNNLTTDSNSSASGINTQPTPVAYTGQSFTHSNQYQDPDNDSLTFQLVQPQTISGTVFDTCNNSLPTFVNYTLPILSAGQPFLTDPQGTLVFDTTNGTMIYSLPASASGYHGYSLIINEYRRSDGAYRGTTVLDAMIRAVDSTTTPILVNGEILANSVSGLALNGIQWDGAVAQPFSFCFSAGRTSTPGRKLSLVHNIDQVLPNALVVVYDQNPDTITVCVNYTPLQGDAGFYTLIFVVTDSVAEVISCDGVTPAFETLYHYIIPFSITETNKIPAIPSVSPVMIFPNPAQGRVLIVAEGMIQYKITTIGGRMVGSGKGNTADLSAVPAGVYMIEVSDMNGLRLHRQKLLVH